MPLLLHHWLSDRKYAITLHHWLSCPQVCNYSSTTDCPVRKYTITPSPLAVLSALNK
ncbi:hypothetical protein DPMN_061177 [Dreissena polymorpha]|uniref:Uncharacterized protein n=1 Tax=Dreissena polymorpha TaxID=45954 RepID=A0A9D4C774_DREPO|nr:hypothetical protein DPMN_061177 [Dreissena polymorpha]